MSGPGPGLTGGEFRLLQRLESTIRGVTTALEGSGEIASLPAHLKALMVEISGLNDTLRQDGPAFVDAHGATVYRSGRRFMPFVKGSADRQLAWREVEPMPAGGPR